jgi:peptidoglycan/xylan/chitin deacetylase (PgdA/CDA1 family)
MVHAFWNRARNALSERATRNWTPHAPYSAASAPLVSFTFDDFPRSAATTGARLLREFDAKGTYFVAGGRAGLHLDGMDQFREDDLLAVAEEGHEIGCHTFSHLRLPAAAKGDIERDLALNSAYVRRVLGDYTMTSFAYPFGAASISSKWFLRHHFPFCRGIWSGINKGRVDFTQLRAAPLDHRLDHTQLAQSLDEAERSNGWLIFFTHDVSESSSPIGCKTRDFALVLEAVTKRSIEILPVRDAGAKVRNISERAH